MFNGYNLTMLENEVYNSIVAIFEQNKIPADIGYMIMEAVGKRFSDSAYYNALTTIKRLQNSLETTYEKPNTEVEENGTTAI